MKKPIDTSSMTPWQRAQADKDRIARYTEEPGKLALSAFRWKLSFNINRGISDFYLHDLVNGEYTLDFNVYLATRGCDLQRPFVWTPLQQQELIVSVLKGIKLPVITVVKYERTTLKVIDGKQRLSTLIAFVKGEFAVEHGGQSWRYQDLTEEAQDTLDQCVTADCGYEYKDRPIPDDELVAWFELINFAGTPQDRQHLLRLNTLNTQTI